MAEWEEPMVEQTTAKNDNKQLNWTTKKNMNVVIMVKGEREQKERVL